MTVHDDGGNDSGQRSRHLIRVKGMEKKCGIDAEPVEEYADARMWDVGGIVRHL